MIFGLHLSKRSNIIMEFDPFCLAERWVFLSFHSEDYLFTNIVSNQPPISWKPFLTPLRIITFQMDFTDRSYGNWPILFGQKSSSRLSYVPLIKISLNKFLYGEYLNYADSGSIQILNLGICERKMRQFPYYLRIGKKNVSLHNMDSKHS
jgi:hypothetical protein